MFQLHPKPCGIVIWLQRPACAEFHSRVSLTAIFSGLIDIVRDIRYAIVLAQVGGKT